MRAELGEAADEVTFVRTFDGMLIGQVWETPFVEVPSGEIDEAAITRIIANFHDDYQARSNTRYEELGVLGVTFRLTAVVPTPKVEYPHPGVRAEGEKPVPTRTTWLRYLEDEDIEANEYDRESLCEGDVIEGPAVIREPLSTTFVAGDQQARVGTVGELCITRAGE
ncbi:MAG: hypothetical protein QM809_06215 [Gordonia sp. (in: high G+C Gram-positive bacteria)]|uniref:hypothetical protein n=1 Tax=Gordonia sp. (in: high G+C Gram-positive bacteria) TaxID=84139 RepID=UPI0039E2F48D